MPISRIIEVAKLSGAHDFILELPQGYDTRVGEHGSNLSGGQRQRIAIARALIMNPRILIFDEATSALDYESERIIQNNMQWIVRGRTVLIIAHRLTAVRNCDQIITIEKGRIAESGSHDDLIQTNGRYASLWIFKGEPVMFTTLSRVFTGRTDDNEFLPAAIEIVETPPLPAGRITAVTISLFFAIAIAWACLGSVDIIATAPGKIMPTGRTKIIQPLDSGVVRAIRVQDGQKVKAGDVLIEIDSTVSASERDRLRNDYMQAMLDAARLKAALHTEGDPASSFVPPQGATQAQIALQKSMLANQVDELHAKLSDLDQQVAQNIGNRDAVASTINKLTESIPYLDKRTQARKLLLEKNYGSKLDYLTVQQDLVEHQQELEVQKGRLTEAEASIAAHKEQRRQAKTNTSITP